MDRPLAHILNPSRTVLPATRAKELAALVWLIERQLVRQINPRLLRDISRGLKRTKPNRKIVKALPLDKPFLQTIQRSKVQPAVKYILTLAFVTASRIDEVLKLDPVLAGLPDNLLVFGATKTNAAGVRRVDHLTLLPTNQPVIQQWLALSTAQRRRVLKTPSAAIAAALRKIPVPKSYHERWQRLDPTSTIRAHLTLHSAKRGAAAYLWAAAAAKKIGPSQVAHALKHKDINSSVVYAPIPKDVARAYNVPKISQLLS
jgi:integrase